MSKRKLDSELAPDAVAGRSNKRLRQLPVHTTQGISSGSKSTVGRTHTTRHRANKSAIHSSSMSRKPEPALHAMTSKSRTEQPGGTAQGDPTPMDMDIDPDSNPDQTTRPEGNKSKSVSEGVGGQLRSKTASKPTRRIRKLPPPRPFPTVAPSVSATGPRSAHTEGKNNICITRRTELGAYLRRCKAVFLEDGYKTLHLSAMGAAIPHLMQLALSLPAILPYALEDIQTEVLTGTVHVQDEIEPLDDDEDIIYQTRGKSTLSIVIRVKDGLNEPTGAAKIGKKNNIGRANSTKGGRKQPKLDSTRSTEPIVVREDELDQ